MRIYTLISRLPYPKSYPGKILMVAFFGTHLPLLGLILYLLTVSASGSVVVPGLLVAVLVATLAGAIATLYVTYSLLMPVRVASEALREYREGGRTPDLPTHFTDHAGRLMADVQETADRLDGTIRSLEHLSTVDPLTSLTNRALFTTRLERALTHGGNEETGIVMVEAYPGRADRGPAVLFLDLDNFKLVNDSLGHGAGDQLLAAVARRLEPCVRPQDTVARFGGDEFTVLLEDATSQEVVGAAKRIVEALNEPFSVDGREIVVGCSVGIVMARSKSGEESEEESRAGAIDEASGLLRKADVALYRAKEGGKGAYVMFEESMDERARERLEVENELRWAIKREELVLYYQPITNLRSGQISGFEALLRWQHLQQGLLLPERFIHVAEESGLMVSVGHWVLKEACRQIVWWSREYPGASALSVNVNLSAKQFERPELVGDIQRILEDTGLDASLLRLEITEGVAMGDDASTVEILQGLKDLGTSIVIDDFGTGYSSLGYLARFPVDSLKIDHSIISGLDQDSKKAAITQAILSLAKSLNYRAVAEGVETTGQLEYLRNLGCEFGQGNLFWEPQTAKAAMDLYLKTLERTPAWASSSTSTTN